MDPVIQGVITSNFIKGIYYRLEFFDTFWTSIKPLGFKAGMACPFQLLQIHGLKQVIS